MTIKDKKEKCKDILNKYEIGHIIKDELNFLISIFKNHPEWKTKRGVGGKNIFIGKDNYGHRCFYITRTDNTITDISYLKSISGKKESDIIKINKACRTAIRSEIVNFRNKNVIYGVTKCSITNEILTKNNTHIDHYDFTFDHMFKIWIASKDIKELVKCLNKDKDLTQSYYFQDKIIKNDFIKFHNKHCKLRAVTVNANLSILK